MHPCTHNYHIPPPYICCAEPNCLNMNEHPPMLAQVCISCLVSLFELLCCLFREHFGFCFFPIPPFDWLVFLLIYSSAFLDYWWIQPSCYIRFLLHQLIICHLWYTDMHCLDEVLCRIWASALAVRLIVQASWPEHPGTKVSYDAAGRCDAAGRWRWRPVFMNDATSIGLRGTTPGYSPARELRQVGMSEPTRRGVDNAMGGVFPSYHGSLRGDGW